jgi:glucose-6-phosphate 1-dehydrogenase
MSPRTVTVRASRKVDRIRPRMKQSCVLVIFGASGDLTARKLMPALYALHRSGGLDKCFGILGVARAEMTDDAFRDAMREAVKRSDEPRFDARTWGTFAKRLHYLAGDLADPEAYRALGREIETLGIGPGGGNRLYYLGVPSMLMPDIVDGLGGAGLTSEDGGWTRIVVEKPFGWDLTSARELNAGIARHFSENQVFRIDHYLGKETVQNILVFRFGNTILEPVWNRNYVEYVEITVAEALGVGTRAGFYEKTGALRDVVANHMLQLLTLTAMEPPSGYDPDAVREEKVQVLRSIRPMTAEEVRARTVRGQYEGYREVKGVAPDSTAETYAAVDLRVDNWRWAGVPFYLRTGKRLARTVSEIAVHLKPTPTRLFAGEGEGDPNLVVIRLAPDEGIDVAFRAKQPGEEMKTAGVRMAFDYEKAFGVEIPEAYETLLLDVIEGDVTHFLRADEVEAQWALTDPITQAWSAARPTDFPNYTEAGEGPASAVALTAKNGHMWRGLTGE